MYMTDCQLKDAADYEKLKEALLKNFDMTERGFRKKFRYERPEKSETFIQFGSRLRSYLDKWLKMAKIEESYEAVCDFLYSCSGELYVHLRKWLKRQTYSQRRVAAFIPALIKHSAILKEDRNINSTVNRLENQR